MSQGLHKYTQNMMQINLKLSNFSFKWDNFVLKSMMVPFKNNSNKKQKQNKKGCILQKHLHFHFHSHMCIILIHFFFNFDKLMYCFKF